MDFKRNQNNTMASNAYVVTNPCISCGAVSHVQVDEDKYNEWQNGKSIQDVWPDKDTNWRELLITGTHGDCWDKMFGPDE